jgi:hypothetical protein
MDYSKFCFIKNKNSNELGTICIILNNFEKNENNNNKIIAHIIKICTNALLLSQKNGNDSFNVEIDASNISLKQLDKKLAKNLAITLQQLFPDKLNKCIIYNTPTFFYHFYDIIKIFIDKKTRNKITIMKKSKSVPEDYSYCMSQVSTV